MPACPICTKSLETVRQREGIYYRCAACDGRALTVSQIRHVMGDRIATKLLRLLRLGNRKGEHACPFCSTPMFVLNTSDPPLEVDACRLCNAVWLDAPTYETLPQINIESTSTLAMQATEIVAMNRLRELKEKEEEQRKNEKEEQKKKKIGHAFGVLWNQK